MKPKLSFALGFYVSLTIRDLQLDHIFSEMNPSLDEMINTVYPEQIQTADEYATQAADELQKAKTSMANLEAEVRRHNASGGYTATTHMASLDHLNPTKRSLESLYRDLAWNFSAENYGKLNFSRVRRTVTDIHLGLQDEARRHPEDAQRRQDADVAFDVSSEIDRLGHKPAISQCAILEKLVCNLSIFHF